VLVSSAAAQPPDMLKAAFVLNFLKFAEWPAEATVSRDAPMVVAVVGDGELATALRTVLNGQTVRGRQVTVRTFPDTAQWRDAAMPGQALFVTPAAQPAWAEIRAALAGRPVLAVSETPGFCAAGGMLNLYERQSRIRFEANPEAAEKAGLRLRAELLRLATIVKTEGTP